MQTSTLAILKNFANINQGILITPGSRLRTISVMKNIYAEAVIDDEFEREFAIYDLNEFLSAISLLDNPSLEYKEKYILISSGRSKIHYYYSSPTVVVSPPIDREITVKGDVRFRLPKDVLERILKSASIMKLTDLQINPDGLTVFNAQMPGNSLQIEIEGIEADDDAESKTIKIENLKMIPDEYLVEASERAARFTTENGTRMYFIGAEVD